MPISVLCQCGKRLRAKDQLAGKCVKCPACGDMLTVTAAEVPDLPPPRPRQRANERSRGEEEDLGAHRLTRFGIGWVILLNVVTVGLFATIRFNLMHGKMPKIRRDDPSAGRAIGFLFIPFFNLYWFFFTYLRLITRINEQRVWRGLPPSHLHGLFIAFGVVHLVSGIILSFVFPPGIWINPISLIFGCILFSLIQGRVNELVEASAFAPAREAENRGRSKTCPRCAERVKAAAAACRFCGHEFVESEADTPRRNEDDSALAVDLRRVVCRNRRSLCLTWGWLSTGVGLAFLGITIPYVLGFGVPPDDGPGLIGRIVGTLFFTVPLLIPGFICLFRARRYREELQRIDEQTFRRSDSPKRPTSLATR